MQTLISSFHAGGGSADAWNKSFKFRYPAWLLPGARQAWRQKFVGIKCGENHIRGTFPPMGDDGARHYLT
ncbi:MAG: hypothetical protein ACTHZI_00885 [Luteimonas sp.]